MHLADHFYHVYNRGCGREHIFLRAGNYLFLLRQAKAFLPDYALTMIAYCLMPNHYHFLFRVEQDGALSPFIQRLFSSYTQSFNRQEGRRGTLFAGRAKSVLVDTDKYVLHLCRYIHLNPVRAGLAAHPADWLYSNYLDWVERRGGTLLDRDFVQGYFATPDEYEAFVLREIEPGVDLRLQAYHWD